MKSNVKSWLVGRAALMAVALCFSAAPGKAQNAYQGKFTLPYEAHWGAAVLPAGEYTFVLPSVAGPPYLVFVRGAMQQPMIMAVAADPKVTSDHSRLTLKQRGDEQFVEKLEAREVGVTFYFAEHKGRVKSAPRHPEEARQVSITPAGK